MKNLCSRLLFKPLCFKNIKLFDNNCHAFASFKKVKDSKQSQLKKDESVDTKLIKTSTNLKSQLKNDLKN